MGSGDGSKERSVDKSKEVPEEDSENGLKKRSGDVNTTTLLLSTGSVPLYQISPNLSTLEMFTLNLPRFVMAFFKIQYIYFLHFVSDP